VGIIRDTTANPVKEPAKRPTDRFDVAHSPPVTQVKVPGDRTGDSLCVAVFFDEDDVRHLFPLVRAAEFVDGIPVDRHCHALAAADDHGLFFRIHIGVVEALLLGFFSEFFQGYLWGGHISLFSGE